MKIIRVLHVLGGLNSGGMESMIMNYYRNLDRSKVQFDFLVFSERSFFDDEVEKLGGKIYRVTPRRKNFFKNLSEIDEFFKIHTEYKIVHIHQGILNLTALKKANKYKVPNIIVHSHGVDLKQLKKLRIYNEFYIKPKVSKLANNYFACSESVVKHIFSNNIVKSKKYNIIKNAIDCEKFIYNNDIRNKVRNQFNINNKFVIGHVGAFLTVKNHKFILKIFKEVCKKNNDSVLLLVGAGPLENEILREIEDLNLKDKVILVGKAHNVNELMQAMDIFLLPSYFEGLPLVTIEAQASGLKCFISDNITKEISLTNLIEFISLNKSANYWASEIIKYNNNYDRINTKNMIEKSGFDIKKQSKVLQEFYIKKMRIN